MEAVAEGSLQIKTSQKKILPLNLNSLKAIYDKMNAV